MIRLSCALALVAAVATAQDSFSASTKHSGTVRHDPLRLEVDATLGYDGVIPREAIKPQLRAVLGDPGLADRALELRLDGRNRVVAVDARSRADVTLLKSLELGGDSAGLVRSNEPLLVIGQRSTKSPTGQDLVYYEVIVDGQRALAPAGQVLIGEPAAAAGVIGDVLAPAFAAGTKAREARFFHPSGEVFHAKVESEQPSKFRETADGLAGAALIRLGTGFLKAGEWDLSLGMAIRFYDPAAGGPSPTPRANDFDLLVVSWAERFNHLLWRTPFKSNTKDFFDNEYFPAIPYRLEGEEVWLRIVPADIEPQGPNRMGKLLAAVESGQAVFYLEVQGEPERYKTRRGMRSKRRVWTRLAKISLEEHLPEFDQDALHYSPGMAGRGFEPTGWVTRIRRPIYRESQDVREGMIETLQDEE